MANSKTMAVITSGSSDVLDLLRLSGIAITVIKPDELLAGDLNEYSSIMILGGVEEAPLHFFPREKAMLNEQIRKGKKVFSEFCLDTGYVYLMEARSTRYERPVFVSDNIRINGIDPGDILDEQCNTRINLWRATYEGRPLLQYVRNADGYYQTEVTDSMLEDQSCSALWFQEPNLLICTFRLADFVKGRFAPAAKWKSLIKYIAEWVSEQTVDMDVLEKTYQETYHFNRYQDDMPLRQQVKVSISSAIEWFYDASMLIKKYGGYYGVGEGMGASVYPDGNQQKLGSLRLDCTGETALAFFMNHLLDKDEESLKIADELMIIFRDLEIREESPFKGMNVMGMACYQDDCARGMILPILFRCLYTGEKKDLGMAVRSLKFLAGTTGTDGLRVLRTDMRHLQDDRVDGMSLHSCRDGEFTKWSWSNYQMTLRELASEPADTPSAHYNGFYLASLLLAYKITGDAEFKAIGIKGMETMMSYYPFTAREQSETEELCRLVLPLSMLFWVTGERKHKDWLYRVVNDLQKMRHPSGGYLEWDTGYTAVCSNKKDGECSVLSSNGDPIVDMLYSINWLPVGFIQAYFVTGDEHFKALWEGVARFFVSSQVQSANTQIHGAWTRALDVKLMEVYGVPNDVGWAPWSIESGWTVGEITTGLAMGLLADELIRHYQ